MSEDVRRMQEEAERQRRAEAERLRHLREQQLQEQQRKAAEAQKPKPAPPQPTTGAERTITRLQQQASQARVKIEQRQQAKAAAAVPQPVFREAATVAQAKRNIQAAETTIKQVESLKQAWGRKIQWGDKVYDLGTTQGYKDFGKAVRESKSEVNQAKNVLKLYESASWEERTSHKARAAVDRANEVIRRANRIIEQQNAEVEKIAEANKRLIEAKFTHDYKPMTKEEYRAQQIKDTYGYLTAFVMQDIADEDKVAETVARVAPLYMDQAKGEGEFGKWMDRIEELKRDAEARAEWRANEGKAYKDRMKPENRPTLKQLGARLEHIGLTVGQVAIYTLPIAEATALGGPLAAGIVAAGTIATFADPKTRYETALFVGEHPEEFFASIAGALATGMAVSKANQLWGKYKAHLKAADVKRLQAKFDKVVDDYTYREQKLSGSPSRGKDAPPGSLPGFPSELAEKIKGVDPWEEYVFRRMVRGMSESDVSKLRAGVLLEMDGVLEPTFVDELISQYPELKDPFLHPAFKDPNILGKSDLVARATGTGMNMTPLLTAALAIVAKQGYITDAQIKQLIKANTKLLEAYKAQGIQLTSTWTLQDLKDLSLTDAAQAVSVIPVELADTAAMQETIQETVQVVEQVPVEVVEPTPTEPTPTETGRPTPPLLKGKLTPEQAKRRMLIGGPVERYKVKVLYEGGTSTSLTVQAKSYPEAMSKAERIGRTSRRPIIGADLERVA
jgi:hypothetical protein